MAENGNQDNPMRVNRKRQFNTAELNRPRTMKTLEARFPKFTAGQAGFDPDIPFVDDGECSVIPSQMAENGDQDNPMRVVNDPLKCQRQFSTTQLNQPRAMKPLDGQPMTVYSMLVGTTADGSAAAADLSIKFLLESTDKNLILANFTGFMNVVSEDIGEALERHLRTMGVELQRIDIEAPEMLPPQMDVTRRIAALSGDLILAWFAFAILILFKKISEVNYQNYMTSRLRGIRAAIGMMEKEMKDLLFSLDKAQVISTAFGSNMEVKKTILNFLMAYQDTSYPLAGISFYLCDILSWCELDSFKFIYDELVFTRSPVLASPYIFNEWRKLKKVFDKMMECPYPQYYRYFAHPRDAYLLHRRNYPVLMTLAQEIMMEKRGQASVENFVSVSGLEDSPVVSHLKAAHDAFMRKGVVKEVMEAFQFLTGITRESLNMPPQEEIWEQLNPQGGGGEDRIIDQ